MWSRKLIAILLVLVTVGTAVAAAAMIGKVTNKTDFMEITNLKENGALMIRNLDKGISLREVERIQEEFVKKIKTKYPDRVVAVAIPEVPKDAKLIAYAVKIDENGVLNQYFGFADDSESARKVYEKAKEWWYKNDIKSPKSTKASPNWVEIGRNDANYYKNPYGGVTNNFEVRQLINDGSTRYDWFAVKHIFAMEPGHQAFGSEWLNDIGYPIHDYSVSTLSPQLHDWDPYTAQTGQKTITVSLTAGEGISGTWSWSYTQPDVTTLVRTSTYSKIAKWEMRFNNYDVQTSTGGMKPGSCVRVNQPNYCARFSLLDLTSEGRFKKPNWLGYEYHTLKYTWHIKVIY